MIANTKKSITERLKQLEYKKEYLIEAAIMLAQGAIRQPFSVVIANDLFTRLDQCIRQYQSLKSNIEYDRRKAKFKKSECLKREKSK